MPRIARAVIPDLPHHLTQRGNNRQDVFFVDDDKGVYLDLLQQQSERFGLRVLGYCLMTNHVHLIGLPQREDSLARAVGRTHWLYTQHVNRLHGRSGHLWQNRFHSSPFAAAHLRAAMPYVERNPVRPKLVRRAWRYPWSSAAAHVGDANEGELIDLAHWQRIASAAESREALCQPEREDMVERIRLRPRTGRPLGSDKFLSKLESLVGRRLRPLPAGRPKNTRKRTPEARKHNR